MLGILRNSHDVEDSFQRTAVKALQASHQVNPETVRGWLFKIALNEARAIKRTQSIQVRKTQSWTELSESSIKLPQSQAVDLLLENEERETIRSAIDRLPNNQKEVVERRIQRGQKFVEIAEEMGRPLGSVLTWMRRAVSTLKQTQELRRLHSESKLDQEETADTANKHDS